MIIKLFKPEEREVCCLMLLGSCLAELVHWLTERLDLNVLC